MHLAQQSWLHSRHSFGSSKTDRQIMQLKYSSRVPPTTSSIAKRIFGMSFASSLRMVSYLGSTCNGVLEFSDFGYAEANSIGIFARLSFFLSMVGPMSSSSWAPLAAPFPSHPQNLALGYLSYLFPIINS